MKKVIQYQCDICGKNFEGMEECVLCEASHPKPSLKLLYYPGEKYPHSVNVIFDDEKNKTFVKACK